MMAPIRHVQKRDGSVVSFDQTKITEAIWKAAQSVGGSDHGMAEKISNQVCAVLEVFFKDEKNIPSVEQIQDLVEKILIEGGHAKTAKAFILYRQEHEKLREKRADILGMETSSKFSVNAIKVLKQRYLLRDDNHNIIETPEEMMRRVAHTVATADNNYKGFNAEESEKKFYDLISNLDFLPNSPTLMNAGTKRQQLAGCFVIDVEDSIESIFGAIKKTAMIHQTGGGTGFNFSKIRPKGDYIESTHGLASGPVSFMRVFDAATTAMKSGGKRRGANMGILNVDHPDILEFITCKENENKITNFNISVGVTEQFMKAVENNKDYELINPHTKKPVNKLNARSVFELIVANAWKNGEPGLIFLDRIEKDNPTPTLGKLQTTNPCGEQPLLPFEACNLGSINVAHFYKDGDVDWDRLRKTVHLCIHFLDNVIDVSNYLLSEITKIVQGNRKVGLGIMGFADLLVQLKIHYNSAEGTGMGEKLMHFIQDEAKKASGKLGELRGNFPNFEKSTCGKLGWKHMRNATVTTIAPTGTLAMIAECSFGIEPLYAIVYVKEVLDKNELLYINRFFETETKKLDIYNKDLMRKIAQAEGSIKNIREIPADLKKIYVTAEDIAPEWHIRMQAAFQKYTDNGISKTINFPNDATIDDVKKAYLLAFELGCKGITIYRNESRSTQVLRHEHLFEHEEKPQGKQASLPFQESSRKIPGQEWKTKKAREVSLPPIEAKEISEDEIRLKRENRNKNVIQVTTRSCPACSRDAEFSEGCILCLNCGFSASVLEVL